MVGVQGSGFRVQGSSDRVQGSGFRVQGSGCRVQSSGFIHGSGFMVLGSWFMVCSSWFRVQGSGFRVQGSGFRASSSGFRVQGSEFTVQNLKTEQGFGAGYLHPPRLQPPPSRIPLRSHPHSGPPLHRSLHWTARFLPERLVFYCRTTSASTVPCTSRGMSSLRIVLATVPRASHSDYACEHFPFGE